MNQSFFKRQDVLALGGLFVLACILFAPLLFGGQTFHRGDHANYSLPFFHWMHARYSQGLSAAWVQGIANGEPSLDILTSLRYYPPTRVLVTWLSPIFAYNLNYIGHFVFAAWGIYFLARLRACSRQGAFLGALAGGFAGGMFFVLDWYTVIVTVAWFPWMLVGLKVLQDFAGYKRWLGGLLLGLAVGLAASGYPGMLVYAMLPLSALHLVWLFRNSGALLRLKSSSGPLLLAALLAALLIAGPLAGIQRLSDQSQRGAALSFEDSSVNSMSPLVLAQSVAPHALGKLENDSFLGASWRFGTYFPDGMLLYVGIAGLFLVLAGWRRKKEDRSPLLFSLMVLILYALGHWTPLYRWFIELPLLSHLRAPAKAAAFCAPLAALWLADGWDALPSRHGRGLWKSALGLGSALVLTALILFAAEKQVLSFGAAYVENKILMDPLKLKSAAYYMGKLMRWIYWVRIHLLWQGLFALLSAVLFFGARQSKSRFWVLALAVLLFTDLCVNGRGSFSTVDSSYYKHTSKAVAYLKQQQASSVEPFKIFVWGRGEQLLRAFPQGRYEDDLKGELNYAKIPSGNLLLVHGLQQFNGYSPAVLSRSKYLTGWIRDDRPADFDEQTRELMRRRRLWDLGAVRYVLSSRALKAPKLKLVQKSDVWLYENTQALPMAFFAEQVQTGLSAEEAFKALTDVEDPRRLWPRPALLEHQGSIFKAAGSVRWLEQDDQRWSLNVQVAAGGGTLVLSRLWYSGFWRASIDGKEQEMEPVNTGYCALKIPEGSHRVLIQLRSTLWP